jgi:uncharacterized membrane protein
MFSKIVNFSKTTILIIGALLSLEFLFSTMKDNPMSEFSLVISILIIVFIYIKANNFRVQHYDGTMKFGQAFSYIFQVYIFGAILNSLAIFLYTQFYNPVPLEIVKDSTIKMYESMNIKIDDLTYNMFTVLYKPAPFAFVMLFSSLFSGCFWGLILAAFVKKDKDIFTQQ